MSGRRTSGKSGGARPGAGRPKGSLRELAPKEAKEKLADLARSHAPEAIATLVMLMKSGTDSARVSAAQAILDRGYGKPAQSHTVGGDEDSPIQHKITVIYRKPE